MSESAGQAQNRDRLPFTSRVDVKGEAGGSDFLASRDRQGAGSKMPGAGAAQAQNRAREVEESPWRRAGSETPNCADNSQRATSKQSKREKDLQAEALRRGIDPHLLAALKIAAGTAAYGAFARAALADPIRYNNPEHGQSGHYEWLLGAGGHPPPIVLDVKSPPDDQHGIAGTPGTFEQEFFVDRYLPLSISEINHEFNGNNGVFDNWGLRGLADPLDAGTSIGSSLPFDDDFGGSNTTIAYNYYSQRTSEIPEGIQTYLGARWFIGNDENIYYAWIGVVRTGNFLDAFAWGYETNPNTPIPAGAVPEPSTAAEIALGLLAMGYMTRAESRTWIKQKLAEIARLCLTDAKYGGC